MVLIHFLTITMVLTCVHIELILEPIELDPCSCIFIGVGSTYIVKL